MRVKPSWAVMKLTLAHGLRPRLLKQSAEPVSRVCVGLKPGTAPGGLRQALAGGLVAGQLNCFTPRPGDGFFLPAGTVHTLGGGVVVFEVQQNSDMTFRLYDWERIDSVTGQPRLLQVEEGLACVDYSNAVTGPVDPIVEETAMRWM